MMRIYLATSALALVLFLVPGPMGASLGVSAWAQGSAYDKNVNESPWCPGWYRFQPMPERCRRMIHQEAKKGPPAWLVEEAKKFPPRERCYFGKNRWPGDDGTAGC